MEFFFKSVIAPILVIATAIGLYLGAYLPYEKASSFITALQQASQATSFQQFEDDFNASLNLYSPVGQQEVERFTGNQIISLMGQKIPADLSKALTGYMDQVMHIDHPTARGLDFTQEYLLLANAHQIDWVNTGSQSDFMLAEKYYEDGLKLSPDRPQFLYGLLQLYANAGDAQQALPVAEKIHQFWPTDEQVAKIIPELQKAVSSTPTIIVSTSTVTASSVQVNVQH